MKSYSTAPKWISNKLREPLTALVLLVLLISLPAAVWMDLSNLTELALQRQASDLNAMITSIRGFYSSNVVERVLAAHGTNTQIVHNYDAVPGAIPLPATLSLELGRVIADKQSNIGYRFVSDYPFRNRSRHVLDEFETYALARLRARPSEPQVLVSASGLNIVVRTISPVIMGSSCVNCHNSHPDSPKLDWKVGDVRGIQEITVTQPVPLSVWSFKYILAYFVLVTSAGLFFLTIQRKQNKLIRQVNDELHSTNEFLASISRKLSRYLSPQIFKSIFSGAMDVLIQTKRKKLTIFFSDIKDFTSMTESLQPEEMAALINEYFTEMSTIALAHGGTIDKFVGDAILIFFGDPESAGDVNDAKACLHMAINMQRKVAELNVKWRKHGFEEVFQVRMGVNTGFCNVGNFGSIDRMDYTILGAEANLAARLQAVAPAGGIVVSYETYALVRELVAAHALAPMSMKGISREVVPYVIEGLLGDDGQAQQILKEHSAGLDFYLDLGRVDKEKAAHVRAVLQEAIAALDQRTKD